MEAEQITFPTYLSIDGVFVEVQNKRQLDMEIYCAIGHLKDKCKILQEEIERLQAVTN